MSEENKEEIKEKVKENIKEENNTEDANMESELLKTKQELEETTDRFKRIMAEFENFKKRSSKERETLYNSLVADIIASFLPVQDNLEKAIEAKTVDESFKQGIELVTKQISDIFKKFGVEEIETCGKPFDPELHEAVSSVQDETLGEKIVKEEFRKGYKIGNKVIRHAMVVVAN
ncbi:MAG: nucleotide exchange factor GrpE [Clostridia bacterium]